MIADMIEDGVFLLLKNSVYSESVIKLYHYYEYVSDDELCLSEICQMYALF